MQRYSLLVGFLFGLAAFMGVDTATGGTETGDGFDLTKRVWMDGRTVNVFVLLPSAAGGQGPNEPQDERQDVTVYLVGEIDQTDPYGPAIQRPGMNPATGEPISGPDGKQIDFITIPSHDDTFTYHVTRDTPADTLGYWVIPGPAATADTVHTRPQPQNSLAGAPLAWEILLDGKWRPLNHADTVRRGIDAGLLEARFSNWGGVAWLGE